MLKRVPTVQVVDSLAEITRYQDHQLIERSLMNTLCELLCNQELRLYKVLRIEPDIELGLAAYARGGNLIAEEYVQRTDTPDGMSEGIMHAVMHAEITTTQHKETGYTQTTFPIFDAEGEVYSLLVQLCENANFEQQRLAYGILRVYGNYLALLEENHKDRLTGLLNRDVMTKKILETLSRKEYGRRKAGREGGRREKDSSQYCCLGLLDVDYFKTVNDQFGHLMGDEILILIARLMSDLFREEDLLFRYGGEEFAALIQVNTEKDAYNVFERLRTKIETTDFPQIGKLTVSIGLTTIKDQCSPEMVLKEADSALYKAKHKGRNQTLFFADLVSAGELVPIQQQKAGDIDLF